MTDSYVIELAQKSIVVVGLLCAPALVVGLVVGLIVSVFQAATQIQEMTLTFVPKMVAVGAALVFFGPWILRSIIAFTSRLLMSIPDLVH
jgi:flagellar biosynthesis protein FliQ